MPATATTIPIAPLARRKLLAALAAAALPLRHGGAAEGGAGPAASGASPAPTAGEPAVVPRFIAKGPLRWLQLDDVGGMAGVDGVASAAGATAAGLWLLDSGTQATVVHTALAARLPLPSRGTRRISGPGGRLANVPVVQPPQLQIGGTLVPLQDAAVLDLSAHAAAAGEPVLGIVGWQTLGTVPWMFDLAGATWQAGAAVPPPPNAFTLPLLADRALPVVLALLGNRLPMPLLLDTGFAGGLMLWGDTAQALGAAAVDSARVDVAGASGRTAVTAVLLAQLRMAAAQWQGVPTLLLPDSPLGDVAALRGVVGAVGMALFAGAVLGHDPVARCAWTTAGAAPALLPGGFGVVLASSNGRVLAQQVLAGGPAAAAGVLPGDALRALDGAPLSAATPTAVWTRLRGAAEAVFEWQRGIAPRTTLLKRERFFARVS